MTRSVQSACDTERRMNGHVKNMHFQLFRETATTLFSLLLLMAVTSTKATTEGDDQQCGNSLQLSLKLTRIIHKESGDLIKIYKESQGEMSELFCKVPVSGVPDPNISGLESSERIMSIYTQLQGYFPHLKRVHEQQTDLQPSSSPLLDMMTTVSDRSRTLAALISNLYQSLFPNLPVPESAGGLTPLPPSQNIFQQKVYGCVLLKSFKEFLSNVSRELRTVRSQVCRRSPEMNFTL
ncbi:uncharacterized protein LOC117529780 [Thalassophryne amazonica]|uniref:uncharacterized protein LOC117529780 n=1 Tax=Thalassophryne amazonica TaxID=390379 RepID=UPI001471EE32|nr:uncharacterized protein LOC117529780 [Thalassophryne amazonica]